MITRSRGDFFGMHACASVAVCTAKKVAPAVLHLRVCNKPHISLYNSREMIRRWIWEVPS